MVVLVIGMVVVGWGPRLSWGLLQDEAFTAWQAQGGWTGIVPAKLVNPGQSALFAFLEAPFYFPHSPHMELWLRVPALLGTALACYFLYRLAETMVGAGTGALAVLAFVGNLTVLTYSTQARPYTFAVAACLAALWGLVRWLATKSRRHGLLFAVSLALVFHFHFLFGVFVLIPALAIWNHARGGGRVDVRGLAGWLAVSALLLLPLIPLARMFASGHGGFAPFRLPGLDVLLLTLVPGSLLLGAIAFLLMLPVAGRPALRTLKDRSARPLLILLLTWLIAPPVILFAASHVVHQAVLIDRYFIHTIAAQALLVAFAFRGFPPVLARVGLLACFLTFPIIWGLREKPDGPGSWRRPMQAVRALDPAGAAPVFMQAGHPQADALDWKHGVEQNSWVFSPLVTYPLPNRVYPLPFTLNDEVKDYVQRAAASELAEAPVIFYAGLRELPLTDWLPQFFATRGYTATVAVTEDQGLVVMRKAPR